MKKEKKKRKERRDILKGGERKADDLSVRLPSRSLSGSCLERHFQRTTQARPLPHWGVPPAYPPLPARANAWQTPGHRALRLLLRTLTCRAWRSYWRSHVACRTTRGDDRQRNCYTFPIISLGRAGLRPTYRAPLPSYTLQTTFSLMVQGGTRRTRQA